MEKVKVLIVDNGVLDRKMLSDAVNASGQALVEQTASNGSHALERLRHKHYDLVLLSISLNETPVLTSLSIIRREFPALVVLMTGTKAEFIVHGARAVAMGAAGLLYKLPGAAVDNGTDYLARQVAVLLARFSDGRPGENLVYNRSFSGFGGELDRSVPPIGAVSRKPPKGVDLILIAASTGGPVALEKVCVPLPGSLQRPVMVVQHMPKDFTRIMADALDSQAVLNIREGVEGDSIRDGEIVIAPGGMHMTITNVSGANRIRLTSTPPVNGVRPAADVLFASVAEMYRGARVLAVVLTGMGNDGTQGVRLLKQCCDCYCLAQSEKTCVVYGMPRSVYEAGLADEVHDIEQIAERIEQIASGRG